MSIYYELEERYTPRGDWFPMRASASLDEIRKVVRVFMDRCPGKCRYRIVKVVQKEVRTVVK